jgi:phage terminase large subunit GpA-like protein
MLNLAQAKDLYDNVINSWKPKPFLTLSEWSDIHRYLSPTASAEPGKWNTDRVPYVRRIQDCVSDPKIRQVTFMKASQTAGTEILLNAVGYYTHQAPSPIMYMMPSLELCEALSKDRLATMIDQSPALKELFVSKGSKDGGNTILHKEFPGGHITLVGANSPSSIASRPIRVRIADEIDAYPASAGKEGSPLKLADQRTSTFWDKKWLNVSSPRLASTSQISRLYAVSSKESYWVPCPECKSYFTLTWEKIVWTKQNNRLSEAKCRCPECDQEISHNHKTKMLEEGDWLAEDPKNMHKGFFINGLYSPWKSWTDCRDEFLEAKKDRELLKVFTNTTLAQVWDDGDSSEEFAWEPLMARAEEYDTSCVPIKALAVVCGIDTQNDRFELEIVGYGVGHESWGLDYVVIPGDLSQRQVWLDLENQLSRKFTRADGVRLTLNMTCMDSGGKYSREVKAWCKQMRQKGHRIYATKGTGQLNFPIIQRVKRETDAGSGKSAMWMIGVTEAKDRLLDNWLQKEEEGPGYCHFPTSYTEQYYIQLTTETKQVRKRMGTEYHLWVDQGRRNEPLDCRINTIAAIYILNPVYDKLADNQRLAEDKRQQQLLVPNNVKSHKTKVLRKPQKGAFATSW